MLRKKNYVITGLATTTVINTKLSGVENKISDVPELVKD